MLLTLTYIWSKFLVALNNIKNLIVIFRLLSMVYKTHRFTNVLNLIYQFQTKLVAASLLATHMLYAIAKPTTQTIIQRTQHQFYKLRKLFGDVWMRCMWNLENHLSASEMVALLTHMWCINVATIVVGATLTCIFFDSHRWVVW